MIVQYYTMNRGEAMKPGLEARSGDRVLLKGGSVIAGGPDGMTALRNGLESQIPAISFAATAAVRVIRGIRPGRTPGPSFQPEAGEWG
jgi:hypothetical protein